MRHGAIPAERSDSRNRDIAKTGTSDCIHFHIFSIYHEAHYDYFEVLLFPGKVKSGPLNGIESSTGRGL